MPADESLIHPRHYLSDESPVADAGTYSWAGWGSCAACAPGTYQSSIGQSSCLSCGELARKDSLRIDKRGAGFTTRPFNCADSSPVGCMYLVPPRDMLQLQAQARHRDHALSPATLVRPAQLGQDPATPAVSWHKLVCACRCTVTQRQNGCVHVFAVTVNAAILNMTTAFLFRRPRNIFWLWIGQLRRLSSRHLSAIRWPEWLHQLR